jgi:putative heme-binding domain-containing protein
MRKRLVICCSILFVSGISAQGPQRAARSSPQDLPAVNPYSSPADVEAGRKLYSGRCGHCHGQSGEGGRGATINTGQFRHGGSDRELYLVIRNGVPNTEMPGTFSLPEIEVWRMVAYVKQLSRQGATETVSGDVRAGEGVYRKLGCQQCHTVASQGGFAGPDLSTIGSKRAVRFLRESIVEPGKDIPLDYRTVTVVTSGGKSVSGVHLNEDEYSIHLRAVSGELHSFLKKELKDIQLPRTSLMPAYQTLATVDLDNLVAYLSSLK